MESTTTVNIASEHSFLNPASPRSSFTKKQHKQKMQPQCSKRKDKSPIEEMVEAFLTGNRVSFSDDKMNLDKASKKVRKKLYIPPYRPLDVCLGPLRIVIMDTKGQYCKQLFLSICHGLTQLMLGAGNILALGYTLQTNDIHAVLCTVGWHFFSAEAIISLNYGNNWGTIIRARHRKLFHTILQICGVMCTIFGAALVVVKKSISFDPHAITGGIALAMTILNMIMGPIILNQGIRWKVVHASIGMPLFICSSVCFCSGVMKPSFKSWTGEILAYVLIVFIALYTLFIVIMTMCTCVRRIKLLRLS